MDVGSRQPPTRRPEAWNPRRNPGNNEDNMSKISIPTWKITEEAMGDGWKDAFEAAKAFASYLEENLPDLISDEGDEVEFEAEATRLSGCVNNARAYPEVDGEESESMSFRVQNAREKLWERFCETAPEELCA